MAKLLTLSRPNRRVREAVRAWWSAHLQHRRRQRATAVPPGPPAPEAPHIHDGGYGPDEYEPEWMNTYVGWAFQHNGLPIGTFEVWCQWGANDQVVATVPGTDRVCYLSHVTQGEETFFYRVRYRDGDVLGPFSNVWVVDVMV